MFQFKNIAGKQILKIAWFSWKYQTGKLQHLRSSKMKTRKEVPSKRGPSYLFYPLFHSSFLLHANNSMRNKNFKHWLQQFQLNIFFSFSFRFLHTKHNLENGCPTKNTKRKKEMKKNHNLKVKSICYLMIFNRFLSHTCSKQSTNWPSTTWLEQTDIQSDWKISLSSLQVLPQLVVGGELSPVQCLTMHQVWELVYCSSASATASEQP